MARLNHFKTRPKLHSLPIDEYLERIQLHQELPSLPFLKKLHKAHLLHIPFENLDIIFRKKRELDIGKFFEKIVRQKRGGISTELNILFYHLLNGLGFECLLTSGSIFNRDSWGAVFDHPLTIVRLEGADYLADVGSQSLFIEPKQLLKEAIQLDYNQYFRFVMDPDNRFILQKSTDSIDFQKIYRFKLEPVEVIQFMEMYRFYQESPESPFFHEKVVFKHTIEGKVLLSDKYLEVEEKGLKSKIPILHEDDFASKLFEYFGMDYNKLFRERTNQ